MAPITQAIAKFSSSSIGQKIIVAATGVMLMVFVVGHLLGNALIFKGPEAVNTYAQKLHDLGALLWVARIGLLAAVAVHILVTIRLTVRNRQARPARYEYDATLTASKSSRTMIWSGSTILAFIIYHLMHFTWGTFAGYYNPGSEFYLPDGRHDVYKMMVDGFSSWPISIFYIIAMGLLCSHLGHGFASVFQTLGITTRKSRPLIAGASWTFATVIFLGFSSIPVSVLLGLVH